MRAVLLDMDGTLVDSDRAVERAWRTWAREHGVAEGEVIAICHGNSAETTVGRVAPHLGATEARRAARRQLELQYSDLDDVGMAPGADRLLGTIAAGGLPWAVVTTADRRLARARLGAAGIDPPLLVTIEDVARGKPHPDGYRLAAARVAVEPAGCLVVEDSAPGVAAGRAAGMPVAALRGLDADLSIADLSALADWLTG